MSHSVTVRTIRPHDTTDGYRQPGDEYDRTETEAKALEASGVLAIITPKMARKARPTSEPDRRA